MKEEYYAEIQWYHVCSDKNSEDLVGEHQRPLQKYLQSNEKWFWWGVQDTEDHYMAFLQWNELHV